ncbi:MAG: P-loop NTPase [Desulfobacteraceae bacterium]|nr:P-loop NTPase [Desulfobacteraceae bacterium]
MKIITITSGKGGVGKTNIAVNLAVSLAHQGYKTCLFDADIGLANVNILMGLATAHTLEDVISGKKKLNEVIIKNWNKIDIIPGSSGVEQFETLGKKALDNLLNQFSGLEGYDYIIVDTGAGISKPVISFCLASSLLVLAMIPEPTSLTDAYSLLKVLTFNGYKNRVNIVVNRCKTPKFGEKVFEKFKITVSKYIKLDLNYLGMIPEDEKVSDSVSNQSPFLIKYPETQASGAVREITKKILKAKHESPVEIKTFDSFIKTCSDFFKSSLKLARQQPAADSPEENRPEENKPLENKDEELKAANKAEKEIPENINPKDILEFLKKIVENTDKISKELEFIKESLKINKTPSYDNYQIKPEPQEKEENLEPPVLTLDFEKYVNKKK